MVALKPALIYMKLKLQHLVWKRRATRKTAQAYKRIKYEQKMLENTKYRVIKLRETNFF